MRNRNSFRYKSQEPIPDFFLRRAHFNIFEFISRAMYPSKTTGKPYHNQNSVFVPPRRRPKYYVKFGNIEYGHGVKFYSNKKDAKAERNRLNGSCGGGKYRVSLDRRN